MNYIGNSDFKKDSLHQLMNSKMHCTHLVRYILSTLCFLMIGTPTYGQFMKPNGVFLDAVEGEELFELKDSTFIWTEKAELLWFRAAKRVLFDEDALTPDSLLPPGTVLYNDDLEEIGRVINPVRLEEYIDVDGFRRSSFASGILRGYVSNFETHINSRPENSIQSALSGRRGNVAAKIQPVLEALPFETDTEGSYTVHVFYDKDQHNSDGAFPFRMLLIMRGGSVLVCTVSMEGHIESEKAKDQSESLGRYYTWFQRKNDRLEEEIENLTYNYLPL